MQISMQSIEMQSNNIAYTSFFDWIVLVSNSKYTNKNKDSKTVYIKKTYSQSKPFNLIASFIAENVKVSFVKPNKYW